MFWTAQRAISLETPTDMGENTRKVLDRRGVKDMGDSSASRTSVSLLARIRRDPSDQAAWGEFVERYAPKIYRWCRQWKLQEADAEDVTQNVLGKLASRLRTFDYDPALSFRGWLKTVTHHALSDFLAERRRPGLGSGDSDMALLLESLEAREDLLTHLNEEFDREVLEEALARVQLKVPARRWEAFRLTALEGLSGTEAGARLEMNVTTVFTSKCKVQKLVQEEIKRLERK
jgi:RNA polymerase sigma factor (sigma-70 family)